MTEKYKIEHVDGVTRIKFFSKPSYEDTQMVIDEIAANYPYDKRLWDLTNVDFDFTMSEIQAIAAYGKSRFIAPNKLAIVTDSDLAYGEMRAFEVYREEQGHSVARAFRNEEQAREWLVDE
jgi:hypothetical protein